MIAEEGDNEIIRSAWAEFYKLSQLWSHTTLTASKKIQIFQAVVSKGVLYGLSSAWLNAAERRRLDGASSQVPAADSENQALLCIGCFEQDGTRDR